MIEKELSEQSLPISEAEYRNLPELSYSTLSTYEKTGFDGLSHLFDKKESPSLLFGSVVDTLITGGKEEFETLYQVVDINITDSGKEICHQLLSCKNDYASFEEIPESVVSESAKSVGFWKADKWDKIRYREVLKTGNVAAYYNALVKGDKTIIDNSMYKDAEATVRALKESPSTASYFADNDIFSPIRRYYQLKFKTRLKGVGYKCMADLLVVDYEKKKIYPVDLKTSSKTEWHFEDSFLQWNYMIQARLYYAIIRNVLDKDAFFKDFTLENYRFIVVNKFTLTPLVWEFPLTTVQGVLVDEQGNEYRDPLVIGKELQDYLNFRPQVPKGIRQEGVNTINVLRSKTDVH